MTPRYFLPIIAVVIMLISGCTNTQQDTLLDKTMQYGRTAQGFSVGEQNVGDMSLNYMERPGIGPVVLLIHGFSANKETWLKLAAELPDDYYLIAPDLAGHGDSPAPANGDYNLITQTDRLQHLMAAKGFANIHLIGNSMGGAIATIYAARYPDEVASLTLIDAAGVDSPNPSPFMQALSSGKNPLIATDEESFEYRWDMIMEQPPFVPWPIRPAMIRKTINRAEINRIIFDDMLATRDQLQQQDFEAMVEENIHMPVLIIWGAQDRVLDVSSVDVFTSMMPQAETHIMPGTGHVPQIEEADKTAEITAAFIAAVQPTALAQHNTPK